MSKDVVRVENPVSDDPPRTIAYNIAMSGNMSWWWPAESVNVVAELPRLTDGVLDLIETIDVDEHGNTRTVWVKGD